jgi:hypothetical protein
MASLFRDGFARGAVTFSPHSNANQTKIGKDVASDGLQRIASAGWRREKPAPLPGAR